ncbi:MAG: PAAR repeat-containing protein [bacterium]|nr:MAG: PAAR repeat-containing protein [bacterium]
MLSARISDAETCPIIGGALITTGDPTVIIGLMPAARVTDLLTCSGTIIKGGFLSAARITDPTSHGGVISTGYPTVMIGG